jgi:hypothetical protein
MRKKELKKRVAELEAEVAELRERLTWSMPVQRPFTVVPGTIAAPNSNPHAPELIWPGNTWSADWGYDDINNCPCMPQNGGSGVCSCVRPGRDFRTVCMV